MQYVGRAIDSVSKTWSSINPATLSGAVDVIVVQQENGDLSCSPFHVRFGKFQLLRPSQKKVDFIVNGEKTNLPMKLGDGGEAFFVFETAYTAEIPRDYQTSPVISPSSSPEPPSPFKNNEEPDFLDLGESIEGSGIPPGHSLTKRLSYEQAEKLSKRFSVKNIPTKIGQNGDIFLDMQGYKSDNKQVEDSDEVIKMLLKDEFGDTVDLDQLIKEDQEGNILINGPDEITPSPPLSPASSDISSFHIQSDDELEPTERGTIFAKSLRLTNEQLKCLKLKPGVNEIQFSVNEGRAVINSRLFLWSYSVPIVISDIDGTITKSDALGHVLTMIGKDWTHEGVSKLFTDIALNGYNIMYLTARSVGQADTTRNYLNNICQDGIVLPKGPVILSPDRTFAALRREVILKKPEVFKMSCLNDIKSLYGLDNSAKTPFYAGFGNRITDALSYRSVGIPSSRIFTINPDGEVHMELLELAGYKSTYIFITELVDHFFPPVRIQAVNTDKKEKHKKKLFISNDEDYTDVNFWREPIPDLSDLSEDEVTPPPQTSTTTATTSTNTNTNTNTTSSSDDKNQAISSTSPKLGSQTLSALPSSPNIDPIPRPRTSISENILPSQYSDVTTTDLDTATTDPTNIGYLASADFDIGHTYNNNNNNGTTMPTRIQYMRSSTATDADDEDEDDEEDEDYIDDDEDDEDDDEDEVIYEDEEDEEEEYSDYTHEDYSDEEELEEEEEEEDDLLDNELVESLRPNDHSNNNNIGVEISSMKSAPASISANPIAATPTTAISNSNSEDQHPESSSSFKFRKASELMMKNDNNNNDIKNIGASMNRLKLHE